MERPARRSPELPRLSLRDGHGTRAARSFHPVSFHSRVYEPLTATGGGWFLHLLSLWIWGGFRCFSFKAHADMPCAAWTPLAHHDQPSHPTRTVPEPGTWLWTPSELILHSTAVETHGRWGSHQLFLCHCFFLLPQFLIQIFMYKEL